MAARQVVARLGCEASVHLQSRLDHVPDRELGERARRDRSAAPARSPRRLPPEVTAALERLQRLTGPQIARRLGRPRSTVGVALRRLGLGRLAALEPRPPVRHYQRAGPGEPLHVDNKKLGRIDGIGHRISGDRTGPRRHSGWEILHVAIDDAARLAYSEILPDAKKASAIAFLSVTAFEQTPLAQVLSRNDPIPSLRPSSNQLNLFS